MVRALASMLVACMLLSGCGRLATKTQNDEGMHLLLDAEVSATRVGPHELDVQYTVFILNAGTATCNSLSQGIQLEWPPDLQQQLVSGDYTGVVEPFKPGDRGRQTGRWTVTMSGSNWQERLSDLRISVACADPKTDPVRIHPRIRVD
jgi:hypothetical protein